METGWVLTPDVLRRHLADADPEEDIARVLILNSPSNPTGRSHTRSEVQVRCGRPSARQRASVRAGLCACHRLAVPAVPCLLLPGLP